MASHLPLKRITATVRFFWAVSAVRKQLATAEGLIGYTRSALRDTGRHRSLNTRYREGAAASGRNSPFDTGPGTSGSLRSSSSATCSVSPLRSPSQRAAATIRATGQLPTAQNSPLFQAATNTEQPRSLPDQHGGCARVSREQDKSQIVAGSPPVLTS
jgi:hypothetical protein